MTCNQVPQDWDPVPACTDTDANDVFDVTVLELPR